MTTTEAPPTGGRCAELLERLNELRATLIEGGSAGAGNFSAIGMLLADAILDGDDETLYWGIRSLKYIYGQVIDSTACVEERGRVLAFIDIVHNARQRIIPKTVLAELTADSLSRQLLDFLGHQPWGEAKSTEVTRRSARLGATSDAVREAMSSLAGLGMVTPRRLGEAAYWHITPRGKLALHLTRP